MSPTAIHEIRRGLPGEPEDVQSRYLEAEIRKSHPYELPEIVAIPIERGLPAYLAWVADETTSS